MQHYFSRTKHVISIFNDFCSNREFKSDPSDRGRYFNFVLLCGKERSENDNRSLIEKIYIQSGRKDIRSLYSEELFKMGEQFDLLTLEEILAEVSSAIIIIVESMGSACELGAFAYNTEMSKKMLVINDIKYIHDQSFINDGPIRKLKGNAGKEERVFYETFMTNPSGSRVLSTSDRLLTGLTNLVPQMRTMKKEKMKIIADGHVLEVRDVGFFQLIMVELISFFGGIKWTEIYDLVCKIYKVDAINFAFESNNRIEGKQKSNQIIKLLIDILYKSKVLRQQKNDYISINYEEVIVDNDYLYDINKILMKDQDKRRKANLLKIRSKSIISLKKEGIQIWAK